MKTTLILLLVLLVGSCTGQIIVWNGMDLIGVAITALLLIVILLVKVFDKKQPWEK